MNREKLLTLYLYIFGFGNIITSFGIPVLFGDSLLWYPRNLPTDLMVGSLYLAMGIIMVLIAKDPQKHKAFIDFVVLGNIFHALIMVFFAQKPSHIYVDAAFIAIMGVVPLFLYPWPLLTILRYGGNDFDGKGE